MHKLIVAIALAVIVVGCGPSVENVELTLKAEDSLNVINREIEKWNNGHWVDPEGNPVKNSPEKNLLELKRAVISMAMSNKDYKRIKAAVARFESDAEDETEDAKLLKIATDSISKEDFKILHAKYKKHHDQMIEKQTGFWNGLK